MIKRRCNNIKNVRGLGGGQMLREKEFENNIRPGDMDDFTGQPQIIENLRIFIKAAKIPHVKASISRNLSDCEQIIKKN